VRRAPVAVTVAAIGATHALVHPLPASLGATLVTLDLVLLAAGLGRVVRAHGARLAQAEARADHAEQLRAAEEAGRQSAERRLDAVRDLYQAAVRPPAISPDGARNDPARSCQLLPALTPREREVVTLIVRGLTNEEIARQLFLATVTVKTHANRAMTKLRARDRAQLVVLAYQAGLVRPQRL
jgi:DNA-binding NarL/FixJ family response regulator